MSCTGLYADLEHITDITSDSKMLITIFDLYKSHKDSFAKNIVFDSASESFSKYLQKIILTALFTDTSGTVNPHVVQIYFNTATFDEIKKDRKVTLEAQLGVIGGTMGLLTGFSILSAVQIIYYLFRMVLCPNQQRGNSMVIK